MVFGFRAALFIAAIALGLAATPARADQQITGAYVQDVAKLLEVTNAFDVGKQFTTNAMQIFANSLKENPEAVKIILPLFQREMMAEWDKAKPVMVKAITQIYAQYLSHDDIKATIAFYRTPAGKKLAESMPHIMADSMAILAPFGQQISQRAMNTVLTRLKAAKEKSSKKSM